MDIQTVLCFFYYPNLIIKGSYSFRTFKKQVQYHLQPKQRLNLAMSIIGMDLKYQFNKLHNSVFCLVSYCLLPTSDFNTYDNGIIDQFLRIES